MKRVCLVVDHPLRDLEGLVLLGAHLAARGVEVFLVPMYEKHEVWLLRPDFVLLNYLRYAHGSFLRACHASGVAVGVLDTEGGVRADFSTFAAQVEPFLAGVSLYCVWGHTQYKALETSAQRHRVALEETGSPRYDFAVAPWSGALGPVDAGTGPMILVNTNFPLLNSRFKTIEDEILEVVRAGYPESTARIIIEEAQWAQGEMLAATGAVARAFPHALVVLRPHPFEEAGFYEERCSGWANVQVRQEGAVFGWLHRASVLVHHNCSTAIEAVMSGREPIMIDWFAAPLLHQPASASVSRRAGSPDELVAMVGRIMSGDVPPETAALARARAETIAQFFCANDGRAAERVSEAIQRTLGSDATARLGRVAYLWKVVARGKPREQLQRAAIFLLGSGLYRQLRDRLRPGRSRHAKHFDVVEVRAIVERLGRVAPQLSGLVVCPAARSHVSVGWGRGGASSVRIAATRVEAAA